MKSKSVRSSMGGEREMRLVAHKGLAPGLVEVQGQDEGPGKAGLSQART